MLVTLSIRDVVLIDKLDLTFHQGLCVLTGETGAGKSILLDSLGLALGGRADSGLVRPGAKQASVTAAFELEAKSEIETLLEEHGVRNEDGQVVLRRIVGADGRSRAFVNDQPVSVALLRRLGDGMMEIHGHFEQRGLMDPSTHRTLLDTFGGLLGPGRALEALWETWRSAEETLNNAREELEAARRDEEFLRHALEELNSLDPKPGEEAALAEERALLQNSEKLTAALEEAQSALAGGGLNGADGMAGAEQGTIDALRSLERAADKAGKILDVPISALQRASAELAEARSALQSVAGSLDLDPGHLERVDERYFALKDLARKHGVEVDALPALREGLSRRLEGIDSGADHLESLAAEAAQARQAYVAAAEKLGAARRAAAGKLDTAVMRELPPLKLDKATFTTRVETLPEESWGPQGQERAVFEVATNPGSRPGPIGKIASAGELSRFLLALKVVLADAGNRRSLIFDEVDSGVGGATAAAVGQRLARLAAGGQVLVVTHSPQVAAVGNHHWRVRKGAKGEVVATEVAELRPEDRREEIARMLSGAQVTEEARAAADRLMGAA